MGTLPFLLPSRKATHIVRVPVREDNTLHMMIAVPSGICVNRVGIRFSPTVPPVTTYEIETYSFRRYMEEYLPPMLEFTIGFLTAGTGLTGNWLIIGLLISLSLWVAFLLLCVMLPVAALAALLTTAVSLVNLHCRLTYRSHGRVLLDPALPCVAATRDYFVREWGWVYTELVRPLAPQRLPALRDPDAPPAYEVSTVPGLMPRRQRLSSESSESSEKSIQIPVADGFEGYVPR